MSELNAAQNNLAKTIDGLYFLVWYFLNFYCYGYDYCVGDLSLEKHRPNHKNSHRLVNGKRCALPVLHSAPKEKINKLARAGLTSPAQQRT